MNDNEKYIEEYVKDIPFDAPDEKHRDALKKQLLNSLARHRLGPEVHTLPIWATIMRSRIPKLAIAALIAIAVLYGLNGLNVPRHSGGVAWGELIEHVEKIKTVVYQMKMTMKGLPGLPEDQTMEGNMEARLAYEQGFRIDTSITVDNKDVQTITYIVFEEGSIVSVIPTEKKYIKMKLTDELLAQMEKENGDPRTTLKEMMKNEYTELGRDVINGVEVEGIQVTDMKEGPLMRGAMFDEFVFRVWVDVETELPVLMIMKGSASNGEMVLDMTMDNFQWDVQIDPAELEPNIPEDYELLAETELGMGGKGGMDIVEVLKFFAEFADGKYPSSLTGMTVVNEFVEALRAKSAGQEPSEEEMKEVMGNIVKLQTIGMTYATMVQDGNDPAYYGDKVTAEFPHAVLLRWKMAEGTYRVVLGDLTIKDVSAEELAELEALPLNINPYPIKPEPADGTVGMALTGLNLSWMPGAYAAEHKIYFGTSPDELSLLAATDGAECSELPALGRGTTYYWRVDAVTADGEVTPGEIWSFSTGHLVAWWKLDDRAGDVAADSAPNKIDGALLGDPSWVEGALQGALQFDGDGDYIDFGNHPDFDITGQITVSAWIKVAAFDRGWQGIVTKGDSSWRLQRNAGNNGLEFACTGLLIPGNIYGSVYGTVDVNDGLWHHVAGTYDGSQICLYVDGVLDTSASAGGSVKTSDHSVYIGENAEKPDRFWNGLIDDVRIYCYALSADDIKALASPPK